MCSCPGHVLQTSRPRITHLSRLSSASPSPPTSQFFTIKMSEGIVATSYSSGDKFYIDPMKLLPLERFLPRPKGAAPARGGEGVVDPWAASSG